MPHPNPRLLTYQGRTQTLADWARELAIDPGTIRSRLGRLGMSVEEALSRPVDGRFGPGQAGSAAQVRPAPLLVEDSRGRGVARWVEPAGRRSKTFGRWGDPATAQAYNRWAAEWHANQGHPPAPVSDGLPICRLIDRCLSWAEQTYRKHGRQTSEVAGFKAAFRALNVFYGLTPAKDFTPLKLRALQSHWAGEGKAISTCNNYLNKVVRCFSFGVAEGLVPVTVADALKHVRPFVPGRSPAADPVPVEAATETAILAALPHLHPDPARQRVLEAVVRLQWTTGMRPGEVLELRALDVDRSRTPWLYVPASGGKTHHRGKDRRIWLGPVGRAILEPFLLEAEPGQLVFRLPRLDGKPGPAIRITPGYYARCVHDACLAAGVDPWTPHQLRHTKATAVQRRYDADDAVAAALGNSPELARQVYVDCPADAVARRIAEELG